LFLERTQQGYCIDLSLNRFPTLSGTALPAALVTLDAPIPLNSLQSSASMKCGTGDASTSLERWVLNLRGYWLLWRPTQESNLGMGAIGTTRH
jgi:hypothetical protein